MQETRHQFHESLKDLERQTLGGLDMVIQQLDRALESVSCQDLELAGMVIACDDSIDGRYLEIHQGVLSLLARQAPVAGDLRIVAALLHIIRCVERMGDQCVNIAKLVRLSGYEAPKDKDILDAIERMGQLARSAGVAGQRGVRDARRRPRSPPRRPGRGDRPAQPRDLQSRGRGRRRPRGPRVGDVHDSRRALPRAHRGQHDRHCRADGVRRDRAVPRVRGRIAARIDSKPPVITCSGREVSLPSLLPTRIQHPINEMPPREQWEVLHAPRPGFPIGLEGKVRQLSANCGLPSNLRAASRTQQLVAALWVGGRGLRHSRRAGLSRLFPLRGQLTASPGPRMGWDRGAR